jgi:CheY-like chemotaxis protein
VVDDNVDAAKSLAKLLSRLHGQEVRVAHDGPEALAIADEFRPEAFLLDIGLPGMGRQRGRTAAAGAARVRGVLLVALTGWGQEADVERTRAAGFDHHLSSRRARRPSSTCSRSRAGRSMNTEHDPR